MSQDNLKDTAYDRVSGLLTATLLLVGTLTFLLFLVWLTITFRPATRHFQLDDYVFGGPVEGPEKDDELMGMEEVEDLPPALENEFKELTQLISANPSALDPVVGENDFNGGGTGLGGRKPGPGGPGPLQLPSSRKVVRYSTQSVAAYAKQLDSFGIKIAAINRSTYTAVAISKLSKSIETSTIGKKELRKVYVLSFPPGSPFRKYDSQLLKRAKVESKRRLVVNIVPNEIMRRLGELEIRKVGDPKKADRIYETVFGVKPKGKGYEFFVISQIVR